MERTDSDTLTWAVVFSQDVLNVDASDFDIDGTTASLSVASADTYLDSVYYATLSGGDLPDLNGVVSIVVASDNDITNKKGKPSLIGPARLEQELLTRWSIRSRRRRRPSFRLGS